MRDPQRLDPAIRAYLEAENAYCERALADTAELQAALFAEMKGRIKEDDFSVPAPDGAHAYYVRYRKDGQHPLICRQTRDGGGEQILLDGDALARGKAFFQLGATRHSPDHRLLAWSSDDTGSEFYSAPRARRSQPAPISTTSCRTFPAAWCGRRIPRLSTTCGSTKITARSGVFRHRLGTPASDDVRVFAEADPGLLRLRRASRSRGRFADISVHDHETSEVQLLDLADAGRRPDAGRRARDRRAIRRRASSGLPRRAGADHPHQCRRGRGLQDRLDAARHARPRTLARSDSAPARHLHPVVHRPARTG